MARARRTTLESSPSWWLGGGENCEHCLQDYTLTLEFYCVECDRPVCPHCAIVIEETRQVICPACERQSPHDREEL